MPEIKYLFAAIKMSRFTPKQEKAKDKKKEKKKAWLIFKWSHKMSPFVKQGLVFKFLFSYSVKA